MRKSSLILAGMIGFSSWAFATEPEVIQLPENFDAWNLNFKYPLEKLGKPANFFAVPKQAPSPLKEAFKAPAKAAEAKEYFAVAQKYHAGYQFVYEGGDFFAYPIDVTVDGDRVTISRLFNLAAQSTEWSIGVDIDVVGTYDATAGTITIPTPSDFSNGTVAGTIGDDYTEILVSGEVTTDGKMSPANELVLKVVGDFEAITTDMDFGIMNVMGGSAMGTQALYRGFYATLPSDEPKLICFNEMYDLGETFPNQPASNTFTVANVSDADVDFAVEAESDNDALTVDPMDGVIPARSVQTYNVSLNPTEVGDYEGMLTIEYDGNESTPEPIIVFYQAVAIPTPDFSEIVKCGDFTFTTNINAPFEMDTLSDGTRVARSGTHGQATSSKLNVEFEVPEGSIGVFSWKGVSTNISQWYQNAGGYFIDNADAAAKSITGTEDFSDAIEFAPGKHSVRFQYDGIYYTGLDDNNLYVYDLELANTPAEGDVVVLETPEIDLGNFMLKDETPVASQGTIVIRSKGLNNLSVKEVSSDNKAFTATKPNTTAGILETIEIPVTFESAEVGLHEGVITVETSAGTVTANVKALVRRMADFSSVVTEGSDLVTGFSTSEQYPFEVKDGVAYNANAGEADDVATESWFQISFTIPEGKAGYLTWDGTLNGHCPDPQYNWAGDMGYIEYQHPMDSGSLTINPDTTDASSDCFANDDFWKDKLICVPGDHFMKFRYYKNGDGLISERDMLEISNFRIRLEDFNERDVAADVTEINFEDPIFVGDGRYLTATVNIKNTGSAPLELIDVEADAPFYGVIPENQYPVQWNNTIPVSVWFYPSEEGEFEGTVVFKTTSGDVAVTCHGSTKPAEGVLLIGDVENHADGLNAQGWMLHDADGDGEGWNMGYNLWEEWPEYVHSGRDCFGSTSYNPYSGAVKPDNWLFSPVVSIPEDGAMLQWFAASHHHERYAENYSVYVVQAEMINDKENLNTFEPIFSETLEPISADEWQERVINLEDFAGEDVRVLFRHHDCNGQYVLKIDDIFVFTNEKWGTITGVDTINPDADVVSTEIYDVNGLRTTGLVKGVNIVRTTHSDGTVKTTKIFVK